MILLDTNALIFDASEPTRLSAPARRAIERGDAANEIACADISLWEIALLVRSGRVKTPAGTQAYIETLLKSRGIAAMPISPEIAGLYESVLPAAHGDPADRLIAATAVAHNAILVTSDRALRKALGKRALW